MSDHADPTCPTDAEIALEPLRAERIAIVGYGNQGRAQALNLRDGGLDLRVGLRVDSPGRVRAAADGMVVYDVPRAAREATLVVELVPDEVLASVHREEIAPHLAPGAAVGVAHGAALVFDRLQPPPGCDLFLVAPAAPGVELRERFLAGSGVPAVFAIEQDATGGARTRALAYAKAIGCTRSGLWETSVREEAIVDLFGEQTVLCGGMAALAVSAVETLVEAGYRPEIAYLECVHQLRLTATLISRFGVDGMWERVSTTARYGGLLRGPRVIGEESRAALRAALAEIESGAFFAGFRRDLEAGGPELAGMRTAQGRAALEAIGARLRREAGETSPPEGPLERKKPGGPVENGG